MARLKVFDIVLATTAEKAFSSRDLGGSWMKLILTNTHATATVVLRTESGVAGHEIGPGGEYPIGDGHEVFNQDIFLQPEAAMTVGVVAQLA